MGFGFLFSGETKLSLFIRERKMDLAFYLERNESSLFIRGGKKPSLFNREFTPSKKEIFLLFLLFEKNPSFPFCLIEHRVIGRIKDYLKKRKGMKKIKFLNRERSLFLQGISSVFFCNFVHVQLIHRLSMFLSFQNCFEGCFLLSVE